MEKGGRRGHPADAKLGNVCRGHEQVHQVCWLAAVRVRKTLRIGSVSLTKVFQACDERELKTVEARSELAS